MDESKLTFGVYWRVGVIVSIGWMIWAAVERSSIMALLLLPLIAVLWFCAVGVIRPTGAKTIGISAAG